MDMLLAIKTRLGVSPNDMEADTLLKKAFAYTAQQGIAYEKSEDRALVFANHILELKKRLQDKEDFPEIEVSIAEQVPLNYRELSAELLAKLFPEAEIPFSEVVLVAIHLSVAAEGN